MGLWHKPYHVTIEVENNNCRVIKALASYGLKQVKVIDVRASDRGAVKHLVLIPPSQLKQVPVDVLRKAKADMQYLWLESEGCDVCGLILAYGAFLVSGRNIDSSAIMYSFMVPDFSIYQRIIADLEKAGYHVNVKRISKFEHKRNFLTEKQEHLLWLALKSGFFDYPRRIGVRELAAKIGVKPSTFSETCRRALRRLVEHYFGGDSP
ncbi:MAG: helix-turn-helix domain-containing protein [Candidatus Bathyarchaeota archaeon]|nr:helix-turn-helix domain-containing protein [Candidatus Bathyarchaeota archaeon]MCX8177664.1 helix-turn-helix domain-containing protein [Candidatus Bathyarchaeota archaeon]MDW8193919.1 helix-turn-helix domain-containing protein [Nitrososphaerota archaeon]